jgi:hypothetical protein
MTRKKWITLAFVIVVLGAVSLVLNALPGYNYESSDRGWADFEIEWKGRDLAAIEGMFEEYRVSENKPDAFLCITSKPNWLAWSQWWDNATHRRWELPYMEPSPEPELQKLRMKQSEALRGKMTDINEELKALDPDGQPAKQARPTAEQGE